MTISKVLETALSQVGTVEGKNNSNKYGAYYAENNQPWCMYFVQWCFNQANVKLPYFTGSCSELLKWYQSHLPKQVSQEPHVGDIVIYSWGHTGIILQVWTNQSICTIEGNTTPDNSGVQNNGGGVYVRNRTLTNKDWCITPIADAPEDATMIKYNDINEVPEWYADSVIKLISLGVLKSWPISQEMCRVFTVMDRLGLILKTLNDR